MRVLINTLLVVAAVVAAGLAWKLWGPEAPPTPPPPRIVERCDEARGAVPPLTPELSAATLRITPSSLPFTVDGQPPGAQLGPGLHILEADGVRVQVRVEPFASVLVDVRAVDEVPTVLVVGASCATCGHADTELDFTPRRGGLGSPLSVAGAVSRGDWNLAAQQLRGLSEAQHREAGVIRLVAITTWLAAQPTRSRERLAALPSSDPVRRELAQLEKDEAGIEARQLATAAARWNALTERYQRLTDAFSADAPEWSNELTGRFDALTRRLMSGLTAKDAAATEIVLQEATEALLTAVEKLRARHDECAWQRRVWQAL